MTPPDNRTSFPSLFRNPLVLDFPAVLPAKNPPCPTGLCHESPKANPLTRPFFPDLVSRSRLIAPTGFAAQQPVIAQVNPFLRPENNNPIAIHPNPANATLNKKQIPADQVKIFTDKGNEFLKLAQKQGLNLEERLNHFHTALFNFQMLGDVENSKAILYEMQGLYKTQGNEFGKSYTQAQLAFLQGDEKGFTSAIQLYEKMDHVLRDGSVSFSSDQNERIRSDLRMKLSLAYVSRGQLSLAEGHSQKATLDLEQALLLSPSKAIFQLYAEAAHQSGLFDFADHDQQIETLKMKRNFLPYEMGNRPCMSHHQAPPSSFEVREREDKLRKHQTEIDANIFAIGNQSRQNMEKFHRLLNMVYPAGTSLETYEKDTLTGHFLEKFGKPEDAKQSYLKIIREREGKTEAAEVLRYVTANNRLAMMALQENNPVSARTYSDASIKALTNQASTPEIEFLSLQSHFMRAESFLKEGNFEAGRIILEGLRYRASGETGSLHHQLSGKVKCRLAQVYYSNKNMIYLGDQLAAEIKRDYSTNAEVVGDTFYAKAISRVNTSRSLEAIDILRNEVQIPYPHSEVALRIASNPMFSRFLTTQINDKGEKISVLKASSEINEGDWSEALKVAIAKSGESSTERKVTSAAAGGAGVLAALALAPEPVGTKVAAGFVAIGMGIGLLWDRFVSAGEHSDEISDAYHTGISTVNDSQNMMNLFMLGADVSMLFTAGLGGSVAKTFVRESLAVTAEGIASPLLRTGIEVYGDDVALWAGRGVLYASESAAAGFGAYGIYQLEKSIFFQQEFHWDASEALQWIAMGEFINMAARTPFLGTAAAELPAMQRGPLKNIVVDGKVVGQTTSEGLALKWAVDATAGLTVFYGLSKPPENYSEFITQNLLMMGLLHGGGAVGRKITGGSVESLIAKMDKNANESFSKALEKFNQELPPGGFGWEPAFAMADGGMSTRGPVGTSGLSASNGSRPSYLFPTSMMMSRHNEPHVEALAQDFTDRVSNERTLSSEKITELRESIKKNLNENADWRRAHKGDFSFVDKYSPEQLQAIQVVLKVGKVGGQISGNTHLLFRMKETGFLDTQLLTLSNESLKAFSRVSAKTTDGRDFAERIFYDYIESHHTYKSGRVSSGRQSGILFETVFDKNVERSRSRLDLVLEAYFWMDAAKVEGAREVLDGVTGEYFDTHRVVDPHASSGYGPKGWTEISSPNQWRGNIDEAIRMGQIAKENVWRPYYPDALTKADSYLGDVIYRAEGGGRAQDPFQPDGLTRANWAEEYKSTYNGGNRVADFSMSHMKDPSKFQNQVLKYGQAVRDGKINGVNYRVTASSIDPAVIDYIKAHIPNVRVLRYNDISSTEGEVVLEQHQQGEKYPASVSEAQKRAVQNNYPFVTEKGEFTTFRLPEVVEITPQETTQFKDHLLLYTDTIDSKSVSGDLATRIRERAAIQVEWVGKIYERLPSDRRAAVDSKTKEMIHELDSKLSQMKTEEARAKLIYSSIDALCREVIKAELPVWEKVPLDLSGVRLEGGREEVVNGPLDDIPGTLKLYLTDSQVRGPYRRLALRNNLPLSKGTRIYTTNLSPQEAHASSVTPGVRQIEKSRDSVLGFEAELDFNNSNIFDRKTDSEGRTYYELKVDYVLKKGDFSLSYHGDNPRREYLEPLKAAR